MRLPLLTFEKGKARLHARDEKAISLTPSGYCGTGWHEPLVPDSWGNANFSNACKAHDECYETCGNSKENCDRQFEQKMESECRDAYSGGGLDLIKRNACIGVANTYAVAVEQFGGDAYRSAQRGSGC